jgi:transcriptional regulator GlxA family with amidase domain
MPRLHPSGYAVLPVSKAHDDKRIREAEDHLQRNFREDISTHVLADRACMTERTFARRFKAATGKLPAAYLQAVRIEAAKVLLENGSQPIQSIAGAVGYCDLAFFRELFKRATGMTPGQYRATFAPIHVAGQSVLDDETLSVLAAV